jgi:hypothetical protein
MSVHVLRLYGIVSLCILHVKLIISQCLCMSSGCMWLFHCASSMSSWQFHNVYACPQAVCDSSRCILIIMLTILQCLCMFSECECLLHVHPPCQADNFTMSVHVLRLYVTVPCASWLSSWQFHNVCACSQYVSNGSMYIFNVKLTMSQCPCMSPGCMWLFYVHPDSWLLSWQFHNVCACPQNVSDCSMCILHVKLTFTISVHVFSMYVTVPCESSMSSWQLTTSMHVLSMYVNVPCAYIKLTILQCPCMSSACNLHVCLLSVKLIILQFLCMFTGCAFIVVVSYSLYNTDHSYPLELIRK